MVSPTHACTESYANVNVTLGVAIDQLTLGAYVENLFDGDRITCVRPEAFVANWFGVQRARTVGVRAACDV